MDIGSEVSPTPQPPLPRTGEGETSLPTSPLTRRAFLALGLAGAGGLLAACQQVTSPVRSADPRLQDLETPAPKPTPTTAPPVVSSDQATPVPGPPKPGGSVIWAVAADPLDLDPYTSPHASSTETWGDLTYQSLVMFDENLKIVPCLAEAWAVSDDRLTWTFTLRQGVTFHDGSPFEAEDVRFWFERLRSPEMAALRQGWYSQVADVQPKGRFQVEMRLTAPHAPLLATLAALRGSAIVPRRWYQRAGVAARTSAVGSGPFRIAEYVPGSHVRYVKHPDYWEKGLPYLDEIRLEIVPDEAHRVDALQAGRVTYATVGPASAQRLTGNLTVLSSAGPAQRLTVFNTTRKPFDDVRVRQAIALTVDRAATIERVLGGAGHLTGPLPTGHGSWTPPPEALPYRADHEQARQLLAEAGYPDGFEATIRTTSDQPVLLRTAMVLADQLKAVGVTLKVEQLAWGALAASIEGGDFDLYATEIGFLPDPDHYFSLYTGKALLPGRPTFTAWEHARYAEIVEQARMVMDPGARKALYDEAAAILLQEAPAIWWFTENTVEVLHPSVRGYRQSYTGRRLGLKKTWLNR